MLKHKTLIAAIEVAAELRGFSLNGQEQLVVRTRVNTTLAAKARHRRRMAASTFHWQKPIPPR
jgi:hypothetical protein